MNETRFRAVFREFLDRYWGAFHEVLEAQSVTPRRLAGSLFDALIAAHRSFTAVYDGPVERAVDELDGIWHGAAVKRTLSPDAALTRAEIASARERFGEIFDSLIRAGDAFPAVRREVLRRASHGTPRETLRADAAR